MLGIYLWNLEIKYINNLIFQLKNSEKEKIVNGESYILVIPVLKKWWYIRNTKRNSPWVKLLQNVPRHILWLSLSAMVYCTVVYYRLLLIKLITFSVTPSVRREMWPTHSQPIPSMSHHFPANQSKCIWNSIALYPGYPMPCWLGKHRID